MTDEIEMLYFDKERQQWLIYSKSLYDLKDFEKLFDCVGCENVNISDFCTWIENHRRSYWLFHYWYPEGIESFRILGQSGGVCSNGSNILSAMYIRKDYMEELVTQGFRKMVQI